jgi:hypothetical protein
MIASNKNNMIGAYHYNFCIGFILNMNPIYICLAEHGDDGLVVPHRWKLQPSQRIRRGAPAPASET